MPSDLARDSVFAGGAEEIGPLEAKHIESQAYRNAAEPTRVTTTHWHIAWANGLGWGFDGMDGAILALVAPLLLKEFVIDLVAYRNGIQITGLISIAGLLMRSVLPSGAARIAVSIPITVPAPGRFSIMKVAPWVRLICSMTMRAMMSAVPPGGNGLTILMVRVCAWAGSVFGASRKSKVAIEQTKWRC